MNAGTLCVLAAGVLAWALVSERLERLHITAPILFVMLGAALGGPGLLDVAVESDSLEGLARASLVLLLFSDAARVRPSVLRSDAGTPARLLLVGLPLTLILGTVVAWFLLPGVDGWMAILVAACLAPTDAGLCAAMVNDPKLPAGIRQVLNVESGLNDGICTPFVMVAIAGVAATAGLASGHAETEALRELGLGLVIGVAVGAGGGWLLMQAKRHRWMEHGTDSLALLAMPVLAYGACLVVHGNGFIAAFVAGLACARFLTTEVSVDSGLLSGPASPKTLPGVDEAALETTELTGQVLSTVVWFSFGALLRSTIPGIGWQAVLYALLSLTVIRMLPVALALIGGGLDVPTVSFIGWFGPRGLASIVFALVALEELGAGPATLLLQVISATVLGSVVLHGITATPLSNAFRRHWAALDTSHPVHHAPVTAPLRRAFGKRRAPVPDPSITRGG